MKVLMGLALLLTATQAFAFPVCLEEDNCEYVSFDFSAPVEELKQKFDVLAFCQLRVDEGQEIADKLVKKFIYGVERNARESYILSDLDATLRISEGSEYENEFRLWKRFCYKTSDERFFSFLDQFSFSSRKYCMKEEYVDITLWPVYDTVAIYRASSYTRNTQAFGKGPKRPINAKVSCENLLKTWR